MVQQQIKDRWTLSLWQEWTRREESALSFEIIVRLNFLVQRTIKETELIKVKHGANNRTVIFNPFTKPKQQLRTHYPVCYFYATR